jgi:hypothetical protein
LFAHYRLKAVYGGRAASLDGGLGQPAVLCLEKKNYQEAIAPAEGQTGIRMQRRTPL